MEHDHVASEAPCIHDVTQVLKDDRRVVLDVDREVRVELYVYTSLSAPSYYTD